MSDCNRCGKQYVGKTYRKLGRRVYEHAYNTSCFANPDEAPQSYNRLDATTVAKHFGTTPHSWEDVQVKVLEFIHSDPDKEDTTELRRQRQYGSTDSVL